MLLRNVGSRTDYTALYPRRWQHPCQSLKSFTETIIPGSHSPEQMFEPGPDRHEAGILTTGVACYFHPFLYIKLHIAYVPFLYITKNCWLSCSCIAGATYFSVQSLAKQMQVEGKAILITGRGGPYSCETLRIPHFLVRTIGSQMAVRSVLRADRPLPPGRFQILTSVRG
jgi:hypothetical protein